MSFNALQGHDRELCSPEAGGAVEAAATDELSDLELELVAGGKGTYTPKPFNLAMGVVLGLAAY